MPLSVLFWIIYLLALLFSWWGWYDPTPGVWIRRSGGLTILWVLVGILGYRVFGSAITGRRGGCYGIDSADRADPAFGGSASDVAI